MSSSSLRHCLLIIALPVLLLFTVTVSDIMAQPCACPEADYIVRQITVCFDHQMRQVEVTYCNQTFCPAIPYPGDCNPRNLPVTARTVIRKVCPVGFTTMNAQGLMNATVAALGLCCGNQAELFECPDTGRTYNWMISWPQCVYFDLSGCLQGTDQSICCSFLVEFRPNYPTAGVCQTTVLDDCTLQAVPVPCELSTTPVGFPIRLHCSYPVECCW